jgi:6-phosphogluconolactonase (cycloisomerase 2 family)
MSLWLAGCGPTNGLPTLVGEFLYVSNNADGLISEFSINTATGALTSVGTFNAFAAGDLFLMAVHPTNEFLYAADQNNAVLGFDIGDGGFSGQIFFQNSKAPAINGPRAVALAPNGGFVYATNSGGIAAQVSEYSINLKNGVLTSIGTAPTGNIPFGVAVESTGSYAYVVNLFDHSVSQYIVQASGALTPNGTPVVLSNNPSSQPELIATTPPVPSNSSPACAYVTDPGIGVLHELAINSTGLLGDLGQVAAMGDPAGIAVHPNGRLIYTANSFSNSISVFTQTSTVGVPSCAVTLTSQVTASQSADNALSHPISIAVEPSGKYAYTANINNGTVGEYSINSGTGALTAIGEVNTESPANPGSAPISVVTTH